jgi:catechol 2,3-dioxygenase-like lactoylglutathione lyase family enzyme
MNTPATPIPARYAHTNLIAADWQRLARFYAEVFGCQPLQPQRDYAGDNLDRLTAIDGVRLRGIHLRLPGHGDGGPTLEIFSYAPDLPAASPSPNRRGYGHLAFEVEDVARARHAVMAAGGGGIGEVARFPLSGGSAVTAAYVTDPEGNIIELQSWEAAGT